MIASDVNKLCLMMNKIIIKFEIRDSPDRCLCFLLILCRVPFVVL